MNKRFSPEQYLCQQKAAFLGIKDALLFCLTVTFFWGFLTHAYGFFHSSLSHDGLNAFAATVVEERWKIELGRFFVPLYRALFRNELSLPWVIGCLGLFWTGLAVYLVTAFFDVRSRFLTFLIAGVMSTNITYIAQIANFIYEFDFNALSLLLSVMAAYLWNRDRGMPAYLAGTLCLVVSVGIYQSYVAVAVTLILWKSVMELFAGREVKDVLMHGLRGFAMLLLALFLYYVAGLVVYRVTGVTQAERTSVLISFEDIWKNLPWLLIRTPAESIVTFFHPVYKEVYKILFFLLSVMLGICALVVIRRKKYESVRTILIVLLVGLTPLAMGFIYLLTNGEHIHELMLYAVWFFYVFLLLFAFRLCDEDMLPGRRSEWQSWISCVLVLGLLWQNVILANTAYIKKERDADAALSFMTRAVAMMEREEGYVPGETTVAFVGVYACGDTTPGMEKLHSIVGLQYGDAIAADSSHYYFNPYRAYFDYVLNYPVRLCSDEEHERLKNDERVQEMPFFPNGDCIRWVDDIMVVKMGRVP